ncbi:MAG: helix-turn-helix transcriptional regulator [Alphaproteobacteria bacterium]|nr:helix-turn-helix transcriptional regulator [Alphaproteobacteria bacterium]
MAARPRREPPKSEEVLPDDLQSVFGQNLRAARHKAHLTQAQVAERTGLTQQYVSWVEAGHANLTLATMANLAKVVRREVVGLLRRNRGRNTG